MTSVLLKTPCRPVTREAAEAPPLFGLQSQVPHSSVDIEDLYKPNTATYSRS